MKTDLFQSCGHCWVFQICWHIECSTFTAPQSVLGQAIYRIADKVIETPPRFFDGDFDPENFNSDTFINAEEEANSDYDFKLSGIEDLVGGGELTIGELAEMIKTQQFDLIQLKKENQLLKSKLIKAAQQGFKI